MCGGRAQGTLIYRKSRCACVGPGNIGLQVFFPFEPLLFFLFCGAIALVAIILGAVWMYRDAQSRNMDAAIWVVLLVVATLVGNLIGFIIVLVIYLVVRESHPVGMPYGYGYPAPGAPPVPASCPVCGNVMTWYPQYARWYCPTCAQYR
jgi:hypothetical protein